jgi:hypothetical protein
MNPTVLRIIEIGKNFDGDHTETLAKCKQVPQAYFRTLLDERYRAFEFLADMPFEDVFAYVKGLVLCEDCGCGWCPHPGSTTLVIPAFAQIRRRPISEWATIANWIVCNHKNPYSPFNFQRTRDQWIEAQASSQDPVQIAQRAGQIATEYDRRKAGTHQKEVIRQAVDHFKKTGELPASPEIIEMIERQLEAEASNQ